MEKEQKKLLLVAVSVGVFLLVTITVAIVLLTQKNVPQEAGYYASAPIQTSIPSSEIPVRTFEEVTTPIESVVSTQEINISTDNININSISVDSINIDNEQTAVNITADSSDGENLTIQIPKPTTAAVPDTPEIVAIAPVRTQPVATPAPSAAAAPQQTQTQTPPRASAQATAQASAQAAAQAPAPASARTVNDFWIQTGAFSARVRAGDAKDLLAEKGLVSIIENREVNGQLWYRVRLGPYTSEREADYWLALVKAIDGFGESQIRQTTRTQ